MGHRRSPMALGLYSVVRRRWGARGMCRLMEPAWAERRDAKVRDGRNRRGCSKPIRERRRNDSRRDPPLRVERRCAATGGGPSSATRRTPVRRRRCHDPRDHDGRGGGSENRSASKGPTPPRESRRRAIPPSGSSRSPKRRRQVNGRLSRHPPEVSGRKILRRPLRKQGCRKSDRLRIMLIGLRN